MRMCGDEERAAWKENANEYLLQFFDKLNP